MSNKIQNLGRGVQVIAARLDPRPPLAPFLALTCVSAALLVVAMLQQVLGT